MTSPSYSVRTLQDPIPLESNPRIFSSIVILLSAFQTCTRRPSPHCIAFLYAFLIPSYIRPCDLRSSQLRNVLHASPRFRPAKCSQVQVVRKCKLCRICMKIIVRAPHSTSN
jgi:hypothetical protein